MRIFLVNPDLNLNTFKIKYVRNLIRNFLIFFKISLMKICEGRKSMDQWNCVSELERKKLRLGATTHLRPFSPNLFCQFLQ